MKRKVLLINPKFQLQFMAWAAVLAVMLISIFHLAHLWFFRNLREQALRAGLPDSHVFFQFIQDRQAEMNTITIATFLVVAVTIGIVGLLLSHRIAGPMYRLRKHLEESARLGANRPLKFRDGDYFQEIPEAYNLQFEKKE